MWPPDPRIPLTSSNTAAIQMYLADLGIITTTKNSANTTYGGGTTPITNCARESTPADSGRMTAASSLSTYLNNLTVATNGNNGTRLASGTGSAGLKTVTLSSTSGQPGYQMYCGHHAPLQSVVHAQEPQLHVHQRYGRRYASRLAAALLHHGNTTRSFSMAAETGKPPDNYELPGNHLLAQELRAQPVPQRNPRREHYLLPEHPDQSGKQHHQG